MKSSMKNKKAQEEIVGFAVIVIIVAVILLIFLGIWLNKPQTSAVESYKAESFIQSFISQTTTCTRDAGNTYESVNELIYRCDLKQSCSDGTSACQALNSTLKSLLQVSWPAGQDRPVKGYALNISSKNNPLIALSEGNSTFNYQTGRYDLPKRGTVYSIDFRIYY